MEQNILARRPWLESPGLFSYGFTSAAVDDEGAADGEIASRLIEAYRRAADDSPQGGATNDLWTVLVSTHHQELIDLVRRRDSTALLRYLQKLPRMPAGSGFLQGAAVFNSLEADAKTQQLRALWLMDNLVGMAEAVGVLPAGRTPPDKASAAELRVTVEREIGAPVHFPRIFDGLFALEPDAAPMHLRSLTTSYAIWQVVRFLSEIEEIDRSELCVAEIGAGSGFTGLVARELGVKSYTIYDLPEVNLVQGYLLLKTLPPDDIRLYGEPDRGQWIAIQPGFAFDEAPSGAFDVAINVDSMPELARSEADRYLARLPTVSRWFFSVNLEPQGGKTSYGTPLSVVRQLVADKPGYRQVLRYQNWIRGGWVDELWKLRQA